MILATDKMAHLGLGYIIANIAFKFAILIGCSLLISIVVGLIFCCAAATSKERHDATQIGNKYDWKDWTATMIGGILSSLVVWI
jgi:VanZ family protein